MLTLASINIDLTFYIILIYAYRKSMKPSNIQKSSINNFENNTKNLQNYIVKDSQDK